MSSVWFLTLLAPSELPHLFGFTISENSLSGGKRLFLITKYDSGMSIPIPHTNMLVRCLSIHRECTSKSEYAYRHPRVFKNAVICPSSPYTP